MRSQFRFFFSDINAGSGRTGGARTRLSSSLLFAVTSAGALAAGGAWAGDPGQDAPTPVAPIVVTGAPNATDAVLALASTTRETLTGDRLERARAASLGETLSRMPGVQNGSFGPAAGRPEIRGQSGPRVAVLVNGMMSRDLSGLSGDHALPIEPFLADRIEVLKGPAAILYGGSAIGGAIDVIDNRIPMSVPDRPLTGRAELRGGYNSGVTGMVRLDGGRGAWAWRADALYRDIPDVRIPGGSKAAGCSDWDTLANDLTIRTLCQVDIGDQTWERDPETGYWVDATPLEDQRITDLNPGREGRLPHSAQTTSAFTLGGGHVTANGYVGVSVQRYDSAYGVPGFAYINYGHLTPSPIDLEVGLTRYDAKAGFRSTLPVIDRIDLKIARSEGEDREIIDGVTHTGLKTTADDVRIDITHRPWRGFSGALGLQTSRSELASEGEEAWLPSITTREEGLFLLEQFAWNGLTLKAGARWDTIDYNVDESTIRPGRGAGSLAEDRSWSIASSSASARYDRWGFFVEARYDDVERAPSLIELYANGNHFGVLTDEQGGAYKLDPERARTVELRAGMQRGRYTLSVSAYDTDFQDRLYLGGTGISRVLPVREWRQGDGRLKGLEVDALVRFDDTPWGDFVLHGFADAVESKPVFHLPEEVDTFEEAMENDDWMDEYMRKNIDGLWFPRMPVSRYGADVSWSLGPWSGAVGAVHHDRQDKTAKNESPSAAYVLVDAHAAYAFDAPGGQWEAFIDAVNLTDEEARPHNSFLRYRAPLTGRAVSAGVRVRF